MESGEWRIENREWRMENGERRMEMRMTGQLVRILDGRTWDLSTEKGHAGLEQALRKYEGKKVRLTIVEVSEKKKGKKATK